VIVNQHKSDTVCNTNCSNRNKRSRILGQTLVEVLVALFILSVGVLPMFSLMLQSSQVSRQAHLQSAAYSVARQEMESLRATNFDARVGNGTDPVVGTFDIPSEVQSQYPQAKMKGDYVVAPLSDTLQQMTIQVSWQNPTARYQQTTSVRLDTMIAKEPGQ